MEVMVALGLLITAISASAPLVVRHGRLLTSARHYRLALDELSNQAERLASLDERTLAAELQMLAPSKFIAHRLPGARLMAELTDGEFNRRLVLNLYWNEGERKSIPLKLATWLPTAAGNADGLAEVDEP